MIPLESDLIRSFLAVAEFGSETAAAEHVGRSQSAVSMQIHRLEASLGQPLFVRHARGMGLSLRGVQFLPYARRLTALLDEAALALREKPASRPLSFAIVSDYADAILPRILPVFAAHFPMDDLVVRCIAAPPHTALATATDFDLAITHGSANDTAHEVLCVDPIVWVTSARHAQHLQNPVPIGRYHSSDWCRDVVLPSLTLQGIEWREVFVCDTVSSMQMAVQAGLAVVPLARSTIPAGCHEVKDEDGFAMIERTRVILRRSPSGGSQAVDALADLARGAMLALAPA